MKFTKKKNLLDKERNNITNSLDEAFNSITEKIVKKKYSIEGCTIDMDFRNKYSIKSEYAEVVDMTTESQHDIGLSVFHVKILKDVSSEPHSHNQSSQLIYVRKGVVFDKITNVRFEAGESFFISKRNRHAVKYLAGAELIFVFIPNVGILDDLSKRDNADNNSK